MRPKLPKSYFYSVFFIFLLMSYQVIAQDRCGTMELLQQKFQTNPSLRISFDNRELQQQRIISERIASGRSMRTAGPVTIPVVFHVVLSRQSLVTDAQILAQLDTLNKDYGGVNMNDSRILPAFRSLFGQSGIQFCLAQRTPNDEPSTGINRFTTTRSSFDYTTNAVKHATTGGVDAWDTDRYMNIWICDLSGSTLGYATFPDDGVKNEQGVAVDYASLPGGTATGYNYGKTLTHETGHYFNLYHIWGDDNGSCNGTDQIADTPNQGNSTNSVHTGVLTDNCTTTAPGIMYQNYMDYTPDAALFMFTKLQVARMETAYNSYRYLLGTSNACTPLNLKSKDAFIKTIISPEQRLCSNTFAPQIVLRNQGSTTLTSVTISMRIDDGPVTTYNWTGSLGTYKEITVMLPTLETQEGNHVLTITTSNPNGTTDEDFSNDVLTKNFIYYEPVAPPIAESFEQQNLPLGWDIVNEDGGNTWERTTLASKTGVASMKMGNRDYLSIGQRDYLRSPTVNIAGTDSAFVSFQVAAANFTGTSSQNTDTLQVLVSTDCGKTYTSVYKKWGSTLVTRSSVTRDAFTPAVNEWRREEINIRQFISSGNILVAFLNSNGNGNDIYIDDVNIRTVTVNPNLKEAGFLVSPNPTDGAISVQFYPHPSKLKAIYIYNVAGQKVDERLVTNGVVSTNVYDFDLKNSPAGLYVVKVVMKDRTLTKKFIKVK